LTGIIDYEAGNITSVCHALHTLGVKHFVSNDRTRLEAAEKIIMPGVGEAQSAMTSLRELDLVDWLKTIRVPFLGICLGMQILFNRSEERNTACLGIVGGTICRFKQNGYKERVKIPHMGWNTISYDRVNPLFTHVPAGTFFYFVHSYYAPVVNETVTRTEYGTEFTSSLHKNNYYGVQFHPEKSGTYGLQVLKNFIELC
jgi:imidazole glycerol-phosphate synthase subunit HisH